MFIFTPSASLVPLKQGDNINTFCQIIFLPCL